MKKKLMHSFYSRISFRKRDKKRSNANSKELALFYSAIDIFCFPTYRKSDSLGLVGLEAMACGCIVIISVMAGPTSYIKNQENGFFFKPRDAVKI